MPSLPAVSPKKVLKALHAAGFYLHRIHGAHHHLKHPRDETLRVTVSLHTGDIAPKTLKSILKQANLTIEEFTELL